jgi:hypothetical protein
MSNPSDSVPRSDERHGTTDQEIAPAAEIRAYLARHGGPSEPARAVTPVAAEPTPPASSEVVSDVKAEPEPTVIARAPATLEPAPVVIEDVATELPVIDAPAVMPPVRVEPAEPAAPESISADSSEPEPAMSEPERVTPEPEPIAAAPEPTAAEPEPIAPEPQLAAVASTVPEPPVSDAAPAATIAPPSLSASPPTPADTNNINVVPERVTNTAPPREPAAPSRSPQVRSNLPLYLLALTTVLALGVVAYQTYLLRQSLNVIDRASQRMDRVQQQNEYVRACRDLSDAYFLVKQRVAPLMAVPDRSNIAGAARISEINRIEAQDAVARFAALGAFLGNAQDAAARERHGQLSRVLTRLAEDAKGMQLTEFDKAFEPADKLFVQVNSDCARVSQFPKT